MTTPKLLLADLHLHQLPIWRLEWNYKFIDHLIKTYGQGPKPMDLFVMGDALEIRDKVDSRVLNQLLHLIREWHVGSVVLMAGQHDSYIPGKSTIFEMDGYQLPNGRVYIADNEMMLYQPTEQDERIYFVPFQRRDEDYRAELAKVPDGATVMTHLPVVEIIEMMGAKNVQGISVNEFDRFKITISGDIHKYYDFEKMKYVGAPSQRDWRDKGCDGMIGMWEDGVFTRIPTIHPKHIEVKSESDIPEEGEYIIKTKRGTNITASNVIASVETASIKIDSVQLTAKGTVDDQLGSYVDNNKPPVEKTQALKYAKDVLEDTNAI